MAYVDFSKPVASSESNALLGFLNSVLTRRGPISVPLRIALMPLFIGLAIPTAWAVPSVIALGTPPPPGGIYSEGRAINDNGQVTGRMSFL
jgi:hypothetical protein